MDQYPVLIRVNQMGQNEYSFRGARSHYFPQYAVPLASAARGPITFRNISAARGPINIRNMRKDYCQIQQNNFRNMRKDYCIFLQDNIRNMRKDYCIFLQNNIRNMPAARGPIKHPQYADSLLPNSAE